MAVYLIRHENIGDGSRVFMKFDGSQSASPILFSDDDSIDDDGAQVWRSTPYQTADVAHSADDAARLLIKWAYRDDEDGEIPAIYSVEEIENEAEVA